MQPRYQFVRTVRAVAVLAAALAIAGTVRAADEKKANAEGTWKWTQQGRNNQSYQSTLKITKDGDKLKGMMTGRNDQQYPVENLKVEGDKISFTVTREFGGNKFVMAYQGTISGDTIKGKTESERGGEKQSRDWEAKREKDSA